MKVEMKKLAALAALALAASFAAAQQEISVKVNGRPVNFRNTPPQSVDGRVLVPLRGVFERMGATVMWDPETRRVRAERGNSRVELHIGDQQARVDGRDVQLDVPAQIVDGATLVPIRFLSESLGAEVHWNEAQQLVDIISSDHDRAEIIDRPIPPPPPPAWQRNPNRDRDRDRDRPAPPIRELVVERNTIIPVTLDDSLSSNRSHRGDIFSATVRTEGSYYGDFPHGTRIEGRVQGARPRHGDEPGVLELVFTRIMLPNGQNVPISGRLIGLQDSQVERGPKGILRATGGQERTAYAGYGAGAGLVIGLAAKKPIEGAIAGGILGLIAGSIRDHSNPRNVELQPGTEFGVRVLQTVTLRN